MFAVAHRFERHRYVKLIRHANKDGVDFGIAAVHEDPHRADLDVAILFLRATTDRRDAGEDLADMHGFADDVVDAGFEETKRVFE